MSHTLFCSWRPSLRTEQALLVGALACILLCLYISSLGLLLLLSALYLVALYACYRGRVSALSYRVLLLLVVLSVSVLPIAIERGDVDTLYYDWGGWGIGYAGLGQALLTGLRSFSTVLVLLLLLQLLPLHRLYTVLRSLGVPKLFVELLELTYRYIFVLEETTQQIRLAQLSRLGYQGGFARQLGDSTLLLSRTFILSQIEADKLYLGLQSRGYEDEVQPSTSQSLKPQLQTTPLLQLHELSYSYAAEQKALRGLSLELKSGTSLALLGHNGAGKSTLFLLLAGLLDSWQGELRLRGELVPVAQRSQLRRSVALVLQNSNYQLFTPSVEDELRYGLTKVGLEGEALELRLEELLDRYELQPLRHRAPHELSEGQKKWLALVAVLATDPEVLLLDEPTAALDAVYTKRVLGLLSELRAAGKTLIVSTHDMELAYALAEEVILLERGVLRQHSAAATFWTDTALLEEVGLAQPWAVRMQALSSTQLPVSPTVVTADSSRPTSSASSGDADYSLAAFLHTPTFPVLCIGGGKGIWRKVQSLLERSIPIHILAPTLCPELAEVVAEGRCSWTQGYYGSHTDLGDARLILVGLGDKVQEAQIAQQLRAGAYLFSCLSDPLLGNVQLGATQHREGITLSLRSDYRLPELTQLLKQYWADQLPEGLADQLKELSILRRASHQASDEARLVAQQAYERTKEQLIAQLSLR